MGYSTSPARNVRTISPPSTIPVHLKNFFILYSLIILILIWQSLERPGNPPQPSRTLRWARPYPQLRADVRPALHVSTLSIRERVYWQEFLRAELLRIRR